MRRYVRHIIIPFALAIHLGAGAQDCYRIIQEGDSTKSLFVANSSLDDSARVVFWPETDVQAQQWILTPHDSASFSLRNVYTGMYLTANERELIQTITPHLWSSDTTTALRPSIIHNGTRMVLLPIKAHLEFNAELRQRMADGFFSQFLKSRGEGFSTFMDGEWKESETLEAVLDVFEQTRDRRYWDIYASCYAYFTKCVGNLWTGVSKVRQYSWYGNDFNDDVMWHVIGAVRASMLSGEKKYLDDAVRNFNAIYHRAFMARQGLMRWAEKSGDRYGANSCINGPTEIAACYIGECTGDENYFDIARRLYARQRQFLFEPTTGHVYDAVVFRPDSTEITKANKWASTYNQGTMLGAAVLLYQHYGDSQYLEDAKKILSYTRSHLCDRHGIINVCQRADGDFQGFKGILMRYAGLYARTFNDEETRHWILRNAQHAYNNTNSHHFGHSAWLTKSAEDNHHNKTDYSTQPFGASTAITAAFSSLNHKP